MSRATPPPPAQDPYAPPVAEAPGPQLPLYTVGQIAAATFLGSPLAGSILMALNYRRIHPAKSVWTVVGGVMATVAIMGIAFLLPDNFPSTPLPAAYTVVTALIAKQSQGPYIDHALKTRGETRASNWRVAGIGLATIVPVLAVTFGVVMLLPEDKVMLGPQQNQEMYFEGGATEQEARKLHDALRKVGFLEEQEATVYLKKEGSGWLVTVILIEGAWDEPETVAFFRQLASELSTELGGPVRIALANEYLLVKKTVGGTGDLPTLLR